ncbi:hypothetical protein JHJ32_08435 [Parapedobacter sp. ISTM3]|uniref:hypothetical protein n=1 Tax=Parapedobacter sp. ISTM3 TaxID=2800130 RepID=UPI0019032D89|nr:hypothetical protein [Parapedobacter sp. ISTM3]MBK1440009.1 hypothetical protein [Parapedobacter sp. ISTM3]
MNTKLAYWMGLTLLVVVWSCPAIGQTFVELEEYEIRSLVFSGHIGEGTEMPVTFCLNVEDRSSGHLGWYSVSGWYQYDRHKKPLALAGIYANQLTLYHFKQPEPADTLVHFLYDDYDSYSFFDMIEKYHSMEGFLEKITIAYEYGTFENRTVSARMVSGEWTDGRKRLPLRIHRDDMDVLQHHSLLKIKCQGHDFQVNLKALGLPLFYRGDHSVAGYNVVDDKLRIVLSYDRPSKAYALGHCGAGNESGFLWLELDENGRLLRMEDYLMDSCLLGLSSQRGNMDENRENYIVTDGEAQRLLVFNREAMDLKWEEGG